MYFILFSAYWDTRKGSQPVEMSPIEQPHLMVKYYGGISERWENLQKSYT